MKGLLTALILIGLITAPTVFAESFSELHQTPPITYNDGAVTLTAGWVRYRIYSVIVAQSGEGFKVRALKREIRRHAHIRSGVTSRVRSHSIKPGKLYIVRRGTDASRLTLMVRLSNGNRLVLRDPEDPEIRRFAQRA